MDFKNRVLEHYKMSDSEWEYSINCFTVEQIQAKSFFLKQGEISDKLGALEKGLLRTFYINDNATEITTHFYQPTSVVVSIDSFNKQVPSNEFIVAVEDSEMYILTYKKMLDLINAVPVWKQIATDTYEIKHRNQTRRTLDFQTLTAKERYLQLLLINPSIIQKVALKHIATYLGIDVATLSRIRNNL